MSMNKADGGITAEELATKLSDDLINDLSKEPSEQLKAACLNVAKCAIEFNNNLKEQSSNPFKHPESPWLEGQLRLSIALLGVNKENLGIGQGVTDRDIVKTTMDILCKNMHWKRDTNKIKLMEDQTNVRINELRENNSAAVRTASPVAQSSSGSVIAPNNAVSMNDEADILAKKLSDNLRNNPFVQESGLLRTACLNVATNVIKLKNNPSSPHQAQILQYNIAAFVEQRETLGVLKNPVSIVVNTLYKEGYITRDQQANMTNKVNQYIEVRDSVQKLAPAASLSDPLPTSARTPPGVSPGARTPRGGRNTIGRSI